MMISPEVHRALRERFNPDGSRLRNFQMHLLKMLVFFDGFCRQHGIKYTLSSGTCLGAVRHGGFIPWDDDVDVEMMPQEFEKLISCFKDVDGYAIQTYKNDFFYNYGFAKLRDLHSEVLERRHGGGSMFRYRGVFIDIFVFGYNTFPTRKYQRLKQEAVWLDALARNIASNPLGRKIYSILKNDHFRRVERARRRDTRGTPESLRYSAGTPFYRCVFDSAIFDGTVEMEFEGRMFPVPVGYDRYLTVLYGDYMQIPSEDEIGSYGHYVDFRIAD